MNQQQRRWVFSELVRNATEAEQLLAYALYKVDKDDLVRQGITVRQLSEQQLASERHDFHQQVAHSSRRLNDYRAKARLMVKRLVLRSALDVEAKYQIQIKNLENELWQTWGERAANYSDYLIKPKGVKRWLLLLLRWLSTGASGLLATTVTTLFIVGALSLFQPQLRGVARESLKGIVDALIPPVGDIPTLQINRVINATE